MLFIVQELFILPSKREACGVGGEGFKLYISVYTAFIIMKENQYSFKIGGFSKIVIQF